MICSWFKQKIIRDSMICFSLLLSNAWPGEPGFSACVVLWLGCRFLVSRFFCYFSSSLAFCVFPFVCFVALVHYSFVCLPSWGGGGERGRLAKFVTKFVVPLHRSVYTLDETSV